MSKFKELSNQDKSILIIAIAAIFIIILFLTYSIRDYTLDDALIYYRYLQNALDGKGLVYNEGVRFNGLTSPFYTYISLLVAFISRDIPTSQIILSGIFFFAACMTIIFLLIELKFPVWIAIIPALLVSTTRYFYLTFGLETTLFLFLCIFSLWLFVRKKMFLLGIVSAILFLTRGESAFLIITFIGFYYYENRKFPDWKFFVIPAIILLANYSFNLLYYGSFLPNTLGAKIVQGKSGLWRTWPFLRINFLLFGEYWKIFPIMNKIVFPIFAVISLSGLILNLRKYLVTKIILIFLILYSSFYIYFQIPYYPWYYAVYYFFAMMLFGFTLNWINDVISRKNIKIKYYKIIMLIISSIFFSFLFYRSLTTLSQEKGQTDYKIAAVWIKNNTPQDSKIACVEIGHIGWYSDRYIIDILGLVNPYNARFVGEKKFSEWLKYYFPDYIFVHSPLWVHEKHLQPFIDSVLFSEVNDFKLNGYRILKNNKKNINFE